MPTSPANRDYQAGFTAAMMLKDLKLAQEAAKTAGAKAPMGAGAAALYGLFVEQGNAGTDFSGIIRFLRGRVTLSETIRVARGNGRDRERFNRCGGSIVNRRLHASRRNWTVQLTIHLRK